jgi:hypothetical protein
MSTTLPHKIFFNLVMDNVGCGDFRQPAVNLSLENSDFIHRTFI